ncbi:MAG TPA: hypothetical protein VHO91_10330, partial [Rhodopila sp.]|nr:hypothetical protein [Rhodopila sp.]
APRSITRALGIQGREDLVRLYGARELGSGMLSLSLEKDAGLWSRVAGDGLDIVSVATAYRRDNPKRGNIGLALVVLAGVTVLDVVVAQGVLARHRRKDQPWRDYSHRTGFPQGLASARQVATTESKGKAKGKSGQPALAKT